MFVRRFIACAALVACFATEISGAVSHATTRIVATPRTPATAEAVAGQALIAFRPGTTTAERAAIHARHGGIVIRRIPELDTDLVALPANGMVAYATEPAVTRAEPNYIARVQMHPDDPCFEDPCVPGAYAWQWQWAWDNAQMAWDAYPGKFFSAAERKGLLASNPGKLPKVAVLDTKIDTTHSDWIPAGGTSVDVANGGMLDLADQKDYIPPQNQSGNASYHGTFVAGILGAAANNGDGVAGLGTMSQIMPITVVDGAGTADAASVASGILFAWERGARVINLSLGLTADSGTVHDAIKMATGAIAPAAGVRPPSTGTALVVAAAGNNTGNQAFYPGSYAESMSVAGTDPTDRHALCSNYNSNVSVSAPADGVVSLREHGGVMKGLCGTSAAAPQVSALAAMLFSQNPARTAKQVRDTIERTADDHGSAGKDQYFGWGRINAERALRYGVTSSIVSIATTIPQANGGVSSITATVTTSSAIQQAEFIVDDPGCNGKQGMSFTKVATSTYRLSASLDVTTATAAGPHPLYIRVRDANGWSASGVGALFVDRYRPVLTGTQTSTAAIREIGQPVSIDFSVIDDLSEVFVAALEIRPAAGTSAKPVYTETFYGLALGPHRLNWLPAADVPPGAYKAKLVVADQGLNATTVNYATPFVVA